MLTRRQRSALFSLSDDDLQHIWLRRPSPQQAWLRAGKVEVMSGEMTTLRIVSTAEDLIGIRGVGAGLWSRTTAALGRQAIEGALPDFWLAQETSAALRIFKTPRC